MKPKKLIEVALPIKEISAESVRDKSIRHGHISTLHLWWARRPLPVCRAIVFASLVPDPLDENCPQAFRDAAMELIGKPSIGYDRYAPYKDIPYTAAVDAMEDNLRNRLMMFIGKFSDKCQQEMLAGKSTNPKEQLADGSLIKWENKNNEKVLRIARELIWVAYNADKYSDESYDNLHRQFDNRYDAIKEAEEKLYNIPDRHLGADASSVAKNAEQQLQKAIEEFQNNMPSVFDPFAGGGAIPLEAARLGCRSFGNDINPVAHIIEKGSAEFPQKYGKPIIYSDAEFVRLYGSKGVEMAKEVNRNITHERDGYHIPNRLAWDVEFYAKKILRETEEEVGWMYPENNGHKPIAYYWARTAKCSNPSCGAEVPLLKGFYLCNMTKKKVYLNPIIHGKDIQFEVKNGECGHLTGWNNKGTLTCPCCGSVTDKTHIRDLSVNKELKTKLIAVINESKEGKTYNIPSEIQIDAVTRNLEINDRPTETMAPHTTGGDISIWGYKRWGDMFSDRQLTMLFAFIHQLKRLKKDLKDTDYAHSIITYLAIWVDRITVANTSLGRWDIAREGLQTPFSRQAIAMVFDYPESNPFCKSSGSALNQLEWIIRFIETESSTFPAEFANASSGERSQFKPKELTAAVTDPPYYDAIAYADISDFFYVWLKRTLGDLYPEVFATPQTPKTEECTALKHHHNGSVEEGKRHFEKKLTQIFDAIELQTSDIVSIMFAHQSTEAWTTLCNSILGARMNITGSWAMDTEMANRSIGLSGDALESSVTVACRPSERKGFGEYKDVKKDIEKKVTEEVEKLYALGFRGADLLTACFGMAVGEFGHYKTVEKADGSEVSVGELLELARESAFNALLKGVQGDEQTRFYVGWLQLNGMGDTDYDDVNKFTRVGVDIEIQEVFHNNLLVKDDHNKQHLATAQEHVGGTHTLGMSPNDPLIAQVHRAMLIYKSGDQEKQLRQIRDCAQEATSPFWRLLASLKELLPAGDDATQVQGLLQNADYFRRICTDDSANKAVQGTLEF